MNNVSKGLKKFHDNRKKIKAEILSELRPRFERLLKKRGLGGKYILAIKRKKAVRGEAGDKVK